MRDNKILVLLYEERLKDKNLYLSSKQIKEKISISSGTLFRQLNYLVVNGYVDAKIDIVKHKFCKNLHGRVFRLSDEVFSEW